MLSSIHPLGERARNNRWGFTAGAFVLGAVVGGMVLGSLSGAVGWLLQTVVPLSARTSLVTAAGVIGLGIVGDMVGLAQRLPWPGRQVNEDWLGTYRGWVYGAGFGFQLGAGLFTYVATLGVFVSILIAVLSGSVAFGAFIGAVFGLFRGLPVLTTCRIRDARALREYHRGLARWAQPARIVALTVQSATLIGALAVVAIL